MTSGHTTAFSRHLKTQRVMGNARAFALNAVLCILTIVHELQEENPGPGKVFCTTLTILLEGARRWLERPSFNLDDDEKVWKLLRKLELLIQVRYVASSAVSGLCD